MFQFVIFGNSECEKVHLTDVPFPFPVPYKQSLKQSEKLDALPSVFQIRFRVIHV